MADNSYKRAPKTKEPENTPRNEIRLTTQGRARNYITYIVGLFEPQLLAQLQQQAEGASTTTTAQPGQAYDTVVLKAMRRAINKAVSIAEIVKRRVKGLHQITEIHSTPIVDEWEPKEEGLKPVTTQRTVSSITITLSKRALDTSHPGYQPPIPESEVQPYQLTPAAAAGGVAIDGVGAPGAEGGAAEQQGRGRRRGLRRRGGRGGARRGGAGGAPGARRQEQAPGQQQQQAAPAPVQQQLGGEGNQAGVRRRGRGRGRGRGGRGRGGRGDRGGQQGGAAPAEQ